MVKVNKEELGGNFLGVNNEVWSAAARDLGAHALMLYLYFAANRNGYAFALSPAAIHEAIGMPRSTYRDQFVKLVSKGYLVQTGGNTFAFYEKPQPRAVQPDLNTVAATGRSFEECTITAIPTTDTVNSGAGWNREINNREFSDSGGINIREVGAFGDFIPAPEEKEREGAADWQREFVF